MDERVHLEPAGPALTLSAAAQGATRRAGHGLNKDLFHREEIEQSIVERFLGVVARHPDQLAIVTERHVWTYRQLANVVDQIAGLIVDKCGPDRGRVALLFTHDAPMCAAMLATLRAGKAYVPLDPAYPAARLALIFGDSEPDALLAEELCIDQAREMLDGKSNLIVLDTHLIDPDQAATQSWPDVAPEEMAYVLYTSGSTGRPKGVMQSHRNVLHFICEYTRNLGISESDSMTMLSSYSFDAAVMSTYGALLNGATLHPRSVKASGFSSIGLWLQDQGITIYHSTPTVFRLFMSGAHELTSFPKVRVVVLGGEPVTRSDVEVFNRHFVAGSALVNGLGPTESTVTLQNFIAHGHEQTTGLVSVGTPIGATEVLLLDEHGVPADSEGELAFSSEHLALGYWRRPDQDEKAFQRHATDPLRRIYRTGDLARRDASGCHYFIGRKDLQVKINGVRIELEEVECAVERLSGVRQCVALAQTDLRGQNLIAAYVLRLPDSQPLSALREALRQSLPDSMIPHRFIEVESFPLTPSNKVDRLALGDLHPIDVQAAQSPGALANDEFEEKLTALWFELLGQVPSGHDADFFQCGGDSLTAVQLVDGIEHLTGRRVELGDVFTKRTFAAIAELARSCAGEAPERAGTVVPLTRHAANRGEHLFCICGIQLYQPLADAIGEPVNVSGLFLAVEDEILRGKRVPPLKEIASMYLDVMLEYQPAGPFRLAGVSFGGMLAFEIARQLRERHHEVVFLGIFDTILPQTIGPFRRLRGHIALALRHGPGEILKRLRCKFIRPNRQEALGNLTGLSRDELALERGEIYSIALEAYRTNMPDYAGDTFFYRARERSGFERACFPLHCNWPSYVSGRFLAREVGGGHVTMLEQPFVGDLAALVASDMRLPS